MNCIKSNCILKNKCEKHKYTEFDVTINSADVTVQSILFVFIFTMSKSAIKNIKLIWHTF